MSCILILTIIATVKLVRKLRGSNSSSQHKELADIEENRRIWDDGKADGKEAALGKDCLKDILTSIDCFFFLSYVVIILAM